MGSILVPSAGSRYLWAPPICDGALLLFSSILVCCCSKTPSAYRLRAASSLMYIGAFFEMMCGFGLYSFYEQSGWLLFSYDWPGGFLLVVSITLSFVNGLVALAAASLANVAMPECCCCGIAPAASTDIPLQDLDPTAEQPISKFDLAVDLITLLPHKLPLPPTIGRIRRQQPPERPPPEPEPERPSAS